MGLPGVSHWMWICALHYRIRSFLSALHVLTHLVADPAEGIFKGVHVRALVCLKLNSFLERCFIKYVLYIFS